MLLKSNLNNVKRRLDSYNSRLKTLPKKEQGLLGYQRDIELTEENYKFLKQKQYEARIAIEANVS